MAACGVQVTFQLGAADTEQKVVYDSTAGAYVQTSQQLAALAVLLPAAVALHVLSLQPRGACLNRCGGTAHSVHSPHISLEATQGF